MERIAVCRVAPLLASVLFAGLLSSPLVKADEGAAKADAMLWERPFSHHIGV